MKALVLQSSIGEAVYLNDRYVAEGPKSPSWWEVFAQEHGIDEVLVRKVPPGDDEVIKYMNEWPTNLEELIGQPNQAEVINSDDLPCCSSCGSRPLMMLFNEEYSVDCINDDCLDYKFCSGQTKEAVVSTWKEENYV